MPFLAVGVEHKTAPLPIRERVAMGDEAMVCASRALAEHADIAEVAILSTCNRTEIYLYADAPQAAMDVVTRYFDSHHGDTHSYLQVWRESDVVEHLFRVASGLESQVLGEPQIISQVSKALELGQSIETIGPNLHALFRAAISCSRQARAGSALGRLDVSMGSRAVEAAESAFEGLSGRVVLLVGGGQICRLVANELARHQLKALFIANRTVSVAQDIASNVGGRAAQLTDIPKLIPMSDLIISATGASHYVLTAEDFNAEGLRERPLHIYDLAIPRDVDPSVGLLPGIALHDLDTLLPEGIEGQWDDDIRKMESIIAAEVHEFVSWYLTRRVVPVISNLRSHVEAVQRQEMKRVAPQLADLTDRERQAVDSLTSRLVDKMFHHLVLRLRLAAQTDPKLVEAAEFFFLHGEGGLFEHASETEKRTKTSVQE